MGAECLVAVGQAFQGWLGCRVLNAECWLLGAGCCACKKQIMRGAGAFLPVVRGKRGCPDLNDWCCEIERGL